MGIYRGAGGTGDAVADSSSEALLVRNLAVEVQADADAAAASAAAALVSENNAADSETAAASSASAAASSASTAATQATNASNSASAASTSATNAANSATAAQTAETNAETAETNAETAATNAASSASAASTSATNASNSASAASTSATNASNSASAAATSATNAASSATSAAGSASTAATQASNASTSATNAASSATSAAGSATTATTQAGIATTQATNASNSASAASTSATNAASSASAASTSASNASTSATNAANSATSAGNSATSAAASAAAAAASYDSFDDRYLGVKTAAPTLDNDGNALVTGALYYNDGTVTPADKGMWVYDGSQWIAASAASTAILTVFKYTATAGQTTFTGADDNALTLTYTAGSAIITLNGAVLEVGTDVTATTGTSIVLAQAALVGDEVNIYAFATFNVANVLANTSPSILAGNLNFATTGQRITGDFSGTLFNRVAFQTSTSNSTTAVGILPSGNGVASNIRTYNNSDPTNSSYSALSVDSSVVALASGIAGTGTYLPLTMYTGGSERLRIDTSGNVGIGAVPSTWSLGKSVEVGTVGNSLWGAASADLRLLAGSYFNSGFKYAVSSQPIAKYEISGGTHSWYSAPSGTAGNAVTFTESMRIDSSGNVGIGTSSPGNKLTVYGSNQKISIGSSTDGAGVTIGQWDGSNNRIETTTRPLFFAFYNSQPCIFAPNGNEAMRIDSSGNVGIGTTPSAWTSGRTAIQMSGSSTAVYFAGGTLNTVFSNNYFYQAGDKFINSTSYALSYQQQATGIHAWYTSSAASVSAGSTATMNEVMRITSIGHLLVGTTSHGDGSMFQSASYTPLNCYRADSFGPNGAFGVYSDVGGTKTVRAYIKNDGGLANYSANNVNLSDERLKKDISLAANYLDKLCAIPVKNFRYKDQSESDDITLGVIAQDVLSVAPELVSSEGFGTTSANKENYLAIYQTDLQYAMLKAIQEQQAMIEELKAKVTALEGKL